MSDETYFREKWQLLQVLRSTVEGLLTNGVSNVWNIYGGLNRLHNIMERIFKHGCRVYKQSGEPDFWFFVQGLNWLQPSLATSPSIHECNEYHINLPSRIATNKDLLWLYKSLEDHSLSQKLSWLLSDKEHLLSFLEPWAFLCQENLAEATLVCLRAVEKNQPALLTEIDPSLFLPNWSFYKNSPKKIHRRCSSYPVNMSANSILASATTENTDSSFTASRPTSENATSFDGDAPIKSWSSFPILSENYENLKSCNTAATSSSAKCTPDKKIRPVRTVELSSAIKIDYTNAKNSSSSSSTEGKIMKSIKSKNLIRRNKRANSEKNEQVKRRSSSGSSDTLNYEDSIHLNARTSTEVENEKSVTDSVQIQKQEKPQRKTSYIIGSAPEFSRPWSLEIEGQKDISRTPKKSFIEDGGSSVLPMATGYFPQPKEGQSLTSFLSSAQFARANAELDRENAHFSISEAMIAAIEQLKCNKQLRLADEAADESDEEINNLKQRIRLRRRQKQEEQRKRGTWGKDLLSDGKTDTTTTDQSVSPVSTSPGTASDSIISTDDVDDSDVEGETNLTQLKHSASKASVYSENDVYRSSSRQGTDSGLTDSTMSAEGVALSLISRFSEKHLPRASELKWLVSEQDAPQRLLPLPKSWPISPDEIEAQDRSNSISLRGTIEWAPPRPQIIFTSHPPPVRRILIAKQNYRCAGCGMKVAVEYANRFRYCEYLGRYFCTGCHTNQVSLIPGKILSKWDFNRYPVSNFSYRLLDQMSVDPLFQVNDFNPLLYRRVKQLDRTRTLRLQLFFLKDFIYTCRFAISLQDLLRKEMGHIINDPHLYSIQDFTQVKTGVLPVQLSKLAQDCRNHVLECMLCQANGFVCESCHSKDVIYPWELNKVVRCEKCGACYHISCKRDLTKLECKRCHRLEARRASREVSNAR